MKKSYIVIGIVLVVILAIVMFFIGSYNNLVTLEENVDNKYADIDVQLERRADLIPNLVNTVKGYVEHEDDAIEKVTTARENLVNAKGIEEKANANNELSNALNNLMVIVENYPDLKASTNFINLQDELAGTENRISTARRDYNNVVKDYNAKIKKIPTNIIASMSGFEEKEYFEAEEAKTEVPNVDFSN
ncbi:MAG TPA: LemA family protein [Candidatus Faecimonas intestinavium]|jgi:LemA protein|nr:LemA family protein [Candidatus Faecimonas intestinavium]